LSEKIRLLKEQFEPAINDCQRSRPDLEQVVPYPSHLGGATVRWAFVASRERASTAL